MKTISERVRLLKAAGFLSLGQFEDAVRCVAVLPQGLVLEFAERMLEAERVDGAVKAFRHLGISGYDQFLFVPYLSSHPYEFPIFR